MVNLYVNSGKFSLSIFLIFPYNKNLLIDTVQINKKTVVYRYLFYEPGHVVEELGHFKIIYKTTTCIVTIFVSDNCRMRLDGSILPSDLCATRLYEYFYICLAFLNLTFFINVL